MPDAWFGAKPEEDRRTSARKRAELGVRESTAHLWTPHGRRDNRMPQKSTTSQRGLKWPGRSASEQMAPFMPPTGSHRVQLMFLRAGPSQRLIGAVNSRTAVGVQAASLETFRQHRQDCRRIVAGWRGPWPGPGACRSLPACPERTATTWQSPQTPGCTSDHWGGPGPGGGHSPGSPHPPRGDGADWAAQGGEGEGGPIMEPPLERIKCTQPRAALQASRAGHPQARRGSRAPCSGSCRGHQDGWKW